MTAEHQVVVVFDVVADTREQAAAALCRTLGKDGAHRGNLRAYGVESWWFPEADLKHIDGNDNPALHLVPAPSPCTVPDCPYPASEHRS